MPHLHLEYTANLTQLDTDKALLRLNHALVASGQFGAELDIKSRSLKVESFRVGTGMNPRRDGNEMTHVDPKPETAERRHGTGERIRLRSVILGILLARLPAEGAGLSLAQLAALYGQPSG